MQIEKTDRLAEHWKYIYSKFLHNPACDFDNLYMGV
jgi:hypothetical protein